MKVITTLLLLVVAATLQAQTSTELVPDQNPNYLQSQARYTKFRDSLVQYQNTTVQQTYKAFDWYQEKLDRKNTRFDNRQQRRVNRSMYQNYLFDANPWYGLGWNNWGRNRFFPNIGYRTGNWQFWF